MSYKIAMDEGFKPNVYADSNDLKITGRKPVNTIGIGLNLDETGN